LLLATSALFVASLGYGVVVPALPRASGASASELSVIYASYAAAKIAAQIPGGVWVDRKGARVVLIVALTLYVASLLAFLLPFGAAWFAFVRAVEGMATGFVYPAVFARVLLKGGGSGKSLGAAVGIGSSGLLLGPVLGALLGKDGLLVPILIAAGLGALVLLLAIFDRTKGAAVDEVNAKHEKQRTLKGEASALLTLARDGAFVATMLPIGFNKLTFSSYQGLLPLVGGKDLDLGATGIALLFVLIGVVFAIAQPVGGALVDRFKPRSIVIVMMPLLLGALAAMALPGAVISFAVLFGVHIFAQSVVFTSTMKHAARAHASAATYGGVFGLLSTLTDTMTIVGPLVFLNVYTFANRTTFAIMAAVGVLFALPFLRASGGGTARDSGSG
jgi:MFS family permease